MNIEKVLDRLTENELSLLHRIVEEGYNPKNTSIYKQIGTLFTENDGTRVSRKIKDEILYILGNNVSRIGVGSFSA